MRSAKARNFLSPTFAERPRTQPVGSCHRGAPIRVRASRAREFDSPYSLAFSGSDYPKHARLQQRPVRIMRVSCLFVTAPKLDCSMRTRSGIRRSHASHETAGDSMGRSAVAPEDASRIGEGPPSFSTGVCESRPRLSAQHAQRVALHEAHAFGVAPGAAHQRDSLDAWPARDPP